MAKAFEKWTVLAHKPIEKLGDNLWVARGTMPDPTVTRVMSLARLSDGSLVIHNAIALDDAEMAEIEAWGTPRYLIVPSGFHRQDAKIYKQRYPALRVFCPRGSTKKVAQVVPVDGSYADVPADANVKLAHFDGWKDGEGYLQVNTAGRATLVVNDAICNVPKTGGMTGFFLSPTGRASVPRVMRWLAIKDKRSFAANLDRLAETPGLDRIVVSHGDAITEKPADVLRAVRTEMTA